MWGEYLRQSVLHFNLFTVSSVMLHVLGEKEKASKNNMEVTIKKPCTKLRPLIWYSFIEWYDDENNAYQ